MIVSGGAGILVCRKRARKMRMDDSNSVGNMAMSKKCNVGKITQKQGLEKNSYTGVFFYFLHVSFTKVRTNIINNF